MKKNLFTLLSGKYFLIILIVLIIDNNISLSKNRHSGNGVSNFQIIFVADVRVAANNLWLEKIATDWGATGVCLRIFWGHIDTDTVPGVDNWSYLDRAIKTITESEFNNKKLDIYIRVCMGLQKPTWVSPTNYRFARDDFQIKYDNTLYNHQDYEKGIPESEKYPLNFNSPVSQTFMKNFLEEVLCHIDTQYPDSVKLRIKEVVPTFSTSDEEEYPFAAMCGYSNYENQDFINYLKIKYGNNLSDLNGIWSSENKFVKLNSWSEINPAEYEWQTYNNSDYIYPNGRVDWINFRTEQLASFIGNLFELISSYSFRMGVQIGSIYDGLIERRGWADPTRVFAKTNAIHVADIYQFSENFNFGAVYLSSICKFWTITNESACEPVQFSTETNWPDFYGKNAEFLSFYWKKQLEAYFNQGASEHYLVGWDVTPEKLDKLKSSYELWRNTLVDYSGRELISEKKEIAVYIGLEQVFYNHNEKSILNKRFELNNFFISQYESSQTKSLTNKGEDIITSYMIEKNPGYLVNYDTIYFARENGFISHNAFFSLTNFLKSEFGINKSLNNFKLTNAPLVLYKDEYDKRFKNIPAKITIPK